MLSTAAPKGKRPMRTPGSLRVVLPCAYNVLSFSTLTAEACPINPWRPLNLGRSVVVVVVVFIVAIAAPLVLSVSSLSGFGGHWDQPALGNAGSGKSEGKSLGKYNEVFPRVKINQLNMCGSYS